MILCVQAAFARSTDLDAGVPTIAFMVTDAPPHMQAHLLPPVDQEQLATSGHELTYLAARGLDESTARDVFKTFNKTVLDHFGDRFIINCVLYGDRNELIWANLAQQTGGMLMRPQVYDPTVLAQGLCTVVRSLLRRLVGEAQDEGTVQADQLQGFKLADLSNVNANRATEQDEAGTLAEGDTEVIFQIAMQRMVAGEPVQSWSCHMPSTGSAEPKHVACLLQVLGTVLH